MAPSVHQNGTDGALGMLGGYQSKTSAGGGVGYSSDSSNHRSTSYLASSLLPEACTRLATGLPVAVATALDWWAKSPRIEPGCASFGYVVPTSLRAVATPSSPSRTKAITGPRCIKPAVAL